MNKTKVIIMGAAGRDFHNFQVCFREDPSTEVVGFSAAQNSLNKRLEKSYSALDIPHQFNISFSFDLRFGKVRSFFQSGPLRYILGEWVFSTCTLTRSDLPAGSGR